MKVGGGKGPQEGKDAGFVGIARARAASQPRERAYLFLPDGETSELELDYATLDLRARRVAAALQQELDDPRGKRVLLLHPPGLEQIADFLGCLYAGAIAVPTAPPRPNRSMERTQALAGDSGAALVLTVAAVLETRERLVANAPALAGMRWIATDAIQEGTESAWREHRPDQDELAFLQYTSGSTGAPKGVAVSHGNLAHNEELLRIAFRNERSSTIVSWLPLHHDMGLIGMVLQALYVGAPCVLMPPQQFLARPARWLEAISRHRATLSSAPNFAYDLCVQRVLPQELSGLDLSSWAMAANGAEPIRLDTLERFAEKFAPCGFRREALHPGFGLAEATLIVSYGQEQRAPAHLWLDARELSAGRVVSAAPGTPGAKPVVGCGTTMPGQEIAIVDPDSLRRRAEREVGEIWVRGRSVATGYWNSPEESERTFRARLADSLAGSSERSFLRTGDLGFLDRGELYVTGRMKDLVIVHGENHYPQDLELVAERSHEDLRPSGAAAFAVEIDGCERLALVAEVERRRCENAPAILAAIRAALSETSEIEAAALALIRPGSLLRTSSGKVQRRATREAWLRGELELVAEWRAPPVVELASESAPSERTPEAIEAWLARLVASALGVGVEAIDPASPLAALGLDSLRMVQISHLVERELGVSVPLSRLYDGASLQQIARESPRAHAPVLDSAPSGATPLSYGQRSLWFLHRMAPESAAYHLAAAARVLSPLDSAALERALDALVARHPALRTTIVEDANGEPVQVVQERMSAALEQVDAAAWNDGELLEQVRALVRRPFDLERGPLLRVAWLARRGASDVLALSAHHVVLDQWSLELILSELTQLYEAARLDRAAELPAPVPYADFARRQRAWLEGPEAEAAWRFWSEELSGAPEPAELPADRRRPPAQRHRGRTLRTTLDPALGQRLLHFAREHGATPYLVALSAFEVLLSRATGKDRFLLGTLSSGRAASGDARIVGYLVNPLVLRADLTGAPTFEQVLERARSRAARCFRHADYPFPLLVERLRPARDASRAPLFQVLLAWEHAHGSGDLGALALGQGGAKVRLGGLSLESIELELETSQFDLSLTMAEVREVGSPFSLALEFDTDLFEQASAERLLGAYLRILEEALAEPRLRVADIQLTDAMESEAVAALWNGPELEIQDGDSVYARFVSRAQAQSKDVALVCGARNVAYAELRARVDRLARRLIEHGAGLETVVAVHAGRSLERCVALLAANAAGAAWMSVDPELPLVRKRFLIEDARASLVLSTRGLAVPVAAPSLILDESDACGELPPFEPRMVSADAAAYVLYTSGSTGAPKGVVVSRRSFVVHSLSTIESHAIARDDVVLHMGFVGFDVFVEELFPTLLAGGRVVVREERAPPSAQELHEIVEREGVTVLNVPTAYWHAWTSARLEQRTTVPECLRLVIVGGERAAAGAYATWRSMTGERPRWVNSYGPTEATVTSTCFDPDRSVLDPDAEIPIGRAVPGWRVGVLDRAGRPAPVGMPGQLAIGGLGVARGYLGHPRLTAQAFVPDALSREPGARVFLSGDRARWRADGELEFLGRMDEQVKVHGFRVEPAEVEAELNRVSQVREAVVVPRVDADGATRLVAYAVTSADPEQLRERLAARLPHYLIPSRIVRMDALPRASSGKIDRRALPEPPPLSGVSSEVPQGACEAALAKLWEELLGIKRVGRRDDFFELGGDSIRSIQLASRAARAGYRLSPQDVFLHPRLQDLARAALRFEHDVAEMAGGEVPLTPIQRWFFEQELQQPQHWNQHVLLEIAGAPSDLQLREALLWLVRRHDALRLRFRREDGQWRAEVSDPERAILVETFDLEGLSPKERDAVFERELLRAQVGLDLERGPLVRAVSFRSGERGAMRLLLVAHHLVIDAVSWRLLADELEDALAAMERGEQPQETPAPTPWLAWAKWIGDYAESIGPEELEADDLEAASPSHAGALGGDPGLERDELVLHQVLDRGETARLQGARGNDPGGDEELLVAALAGAISDVGGRSETWIELESHGRSSGGGPDVARTIGWFTELLSVRVDLSGATTPREKLRIVRKELRASRRRGRLRWLARFGGNSAIAERIGAISEPAISFNYLGSLDGALGRGRFRLLSAGRDRAPSARRTRLIEVDARVEDGSLRVDWSHSAGVRSAVQRLSAAFLTHVRELLGACEGEPERNLRMADLDEAQFARVLEQVDRLEAPRGGGA